MTKKYDIDFSGLDAVTNLITPINGASGLSGSKGAKGKNGWFECSVQAKPGTKGIHGESAPPAPYGDNGGHAFDVAITCAEFVGLDLLLSSNGGDGAPGSDGGRGGSGGDGGDAGHQPHHCKKDISGGPGGYAGQGGNAGRGGDGGNAFDIVVITGAAHSGLAISAQSRGGKVGKNGIPGLPGTPGKGGKNSDGTYADNGATNGAGNFGGARTPGRSGSIKQSVDSGKPSSFLKINVTSHSLSRAR